MAALDDFKKFVADEEASQAYKNWRRDNHGGSGYTEASPKPTSEAGLWDTFRAAVVSGQRPTPPALASPYGKGLVDAGVLFLDAPVPPALRVTIAGTPTVREKLTAAIQ